MVKLTIQAEIDLSDAVLALLADSLQCAPAQVEQELMRFAPAAILEFVDMATGAATLASASDVRERRLVRLMLTAFPDTPPGADTVARLFNVTPTAARSLMRATAAKHRLALRELIDSALKKVLASCQGDGNQPYSAVILNPILVELLNARLATASDPQTSVRRTGDSLNNYVIDVASYDFLKASLP